MGVKTFIRTKIKKIGLLAAATALISSHVLPLASVYADPANTTATINYTYSGNGAADIFINGVMLDQGEPDPHAPASGTFNGSIEYTPGTSGTVNVTLATFATMSTITAVNINGTNYPVPTDQADVLALINGQVIEYDLGAIPEAATYTISTTTARSTLMGNFSWSYKDSDRGHDNYVDNGVITLVELEYNGHRYTSKADITAANLPYLQYNEADNGAYNEIMLPTGTKVTLKLMPNAGHQLTSFTVNGGVFEAQEEVGVYSFESVSGNFHLGAHFTAVDDAVATEAEAVESGTITLGDGEIDNGTARLDVKDVDLDAEDVAEFEDAAGDYKVKTYLDISLFQTIYKGTATDTWDEQIRELEGEATITLKLDEGIDGNEIVIVHQKHDGTYEVIPTTYDPVNHTITFKTSSFSNYAIATKTVGTPDTGIMTAEGASAVESKFMPLVNTVIFLGLAALITKKILA